MTTIAPLLDIGSSVKGQPPGNGAADGGLFAETFNNQMRQSSDAGGSQAESRAARPNDNTGAARAPEKPTHKAHAKPAEGRKPAEKAGETAKRADNEGAADEARGGTEETKASSEDKSETSADNQEAAAPEAAPKEAVSQEGSTPPGATALATLLRLNERSAPTVTGEQLPQQGNGLPAQEDVGTGEEASAGLALFRELGLRMAGAKAAPQSVPAEAAGNELPLADKKTAAAGATVDQPVFDRLLEGVRASAARGSAVPEQVATVTAKPQGGDVPRELLTPGAAAGGEATPVNQAPPAAAVSGVTGSANAASAAPAAGTGATQLSVPVPVRQNGWDEAFAQRVTWAAKQGVQEAQVQLNPRELGPVEVRISMQHDQATVSFVAAHQATREAIEQAMPKLRDMLNDAGIQLAQSDVSGQSFAQREQAAAGEGNGRGRGGNGGVSDEEIAAQNVTHVQVGKGMLDYYA